MKPLCVVKIGGALVDSPEALSALVSEVRDLSEDWSVVIVHGGGPQATRMARQFGHEPRIIDGRRVTTALDLEIIQAALCGVVNSQLTAALIGGGVNAAGLSGASGATVRVSKRPPWSIDGRLVDFGFVGDIETIDPSLLQSLVDQGHTPVVASLGIDTTGQVYNVNADTTAAAIAAALPADAFTIVTDSGGLQHDGTLLATCDSELFEQGRRQGWINGGMLVKLKAGFEAVSSGVRDVRIVGPEGLGAGAGTQLVELPVTEAIS